MTGRRLPDVQLDDYQGWTPNQLQPGDYFKLGHLWGVRAPNGDEGMITNRHIVIEHEDGTITVVPSLQFQTGGRWHGYLAHGRWRAAT